MKLSPTLTLSLALAAGIAGAALAQTSPTQGTPSYQQNTQTQTAPTGTTYPQGAVGQATPNSGTAAQTNPNPAQPSAGQAQNNANEQVRAAQQQLRAAGLYNGQVDGLMDPDTMAAVKRFQQQRGLPQTSMLDQPTTNALMSGGTAGSGSTSQAAPTAPGGAGGQTTGQTTGQPTGQQPAR